MSANETTLTLLLKLDGSQASTELPRLTAQIASELAKLNKPNDGAAAAAIASQKTLGQQTVAVQQQTNASVLKQMDAMWAARDKQQAEAIQKQLGIEKAFSSRQVSIAQASENEIEKVFKAREKELSRSSAQQLVVLRQAEKDGEAIVSLANIAQEKVIAGREKQFASSLQKQAEIERAFAAEQTSTVEAVEREIAEVFEERVGIVQASEEAIAKIFADREREQGRSATQQLAITRQTEKEGEAIIAQSNANREKAIKASLANATRAASQSAASQIRAQLETSQAAINSNSLIEKSLASLGDHFNLFIGHRIPIAGGAFVRLTENVKGFVAISKETEGSVLRLGNIIAGIAGKTGKPIEEIKTFLQTFASLGTQVEKDEAAVSTFGPALAQSLIPQLARADAEMSALVASTGEAGVGLAGLAGPIGIAVIAMAALIGALILAEKKMFDLAAASAKVEGKFIDLNQQTGISTELLSAFDVLATTTGSSLDGLSQSFVIFQKHLEEAEDPMSSAAGLFSELGIQTTDTESALRQTFATLARMPEGFRQTAIAQELFGRAGKSVLAIIKETNGNLDEAIKKFRVLGLIVSEEDARAADRFNDELELLHRQFEDLSVELGKEFLPAALEVVRALSDLTKASKPLFDLVGSVGKPVFEVFADSVRAVSLVVSVLNRDFLQTIKILKDLSDRENIPAIVIPDLTIPPIPGAPSELQKAREEARLVRAEVSEAVRFAESQVAEIDRQLRLREVSPAQALEPIIATERAKTEAVVKGLEAQREARGKEFTKDQADREKQADDIQAIDQQIADEQSRFQKFEADKRAEFRVGELQREQAHRRRVLELFLASLNDRITALNRDVQAGINSERFGQDVTVELLKAGFQKRKQILEQERREAGKDPAIVQQINSQLADLQRERTATLAEQASRRTEILRSETQKALDLQRETINSLLRVTEIVSESRIASIKALADLEVKSEEQAAREILRIRIAAIDQEKEIAQTERDVVDSRIKERLNDFFKQRQILERQLAEADSITDPAEKANERKRIREELLANINAEIDAQKKANKDRADADTELNNTLRVLNAQRNQITAEGERDIEEKRQKDLENARRYTRELEQITARTVDIEQDTAREIIDLMEIHFARRKDIIRAQRDFELTEERLRHERVTDSINRQKSEIDEQIRFLDLHLKALRIGTQEEIDESNRLIKKLEELRQKRAELSRQQQAEDEFNTTRKRRVTDTSAQEERNADPLGRLELDGERLEEFAANLEDSIIPINELLTDSFLSVADAIGQTVESWILLGETGPAIGRKILAQALANLAKEATVNALKETALGFASLFFNPAESAAHFTAAGIWALVAGGAALGGRESAGDLFKQQKSTNGSGTSSSTGPNQINPVTLSRNAGTPPQPTVLVKIQADGEMMRAFTVSTVQENFRSGGVLRETFNNDGGV